MTENQMNMKSKRAPRRPGAGCRGANRGEKTTLPPSQASTQPRGVKPFAGKVFYLDLPSSRVAEALERDLTDLGGHVEKFFSKDIRYLVSNKREAKYVRCLGQDSPVPSPVSGPSSPQVPPARPGSTGNLKNKSGVPTEAVISSRGKSLVERAVKEKERLQVNKILSKALEWGVKILYIDDILAYVEKKKKAFGVRCPDPAADKTSVRTEAATKLRLQRSRGRRIREPFVKVEDSSRLYRPIYLTLAAVPEINLTTAAPCCPFQTEDKDQARPGQRGLRGARAPASEKKAPGRRRSKDKRRAGYCECCMMRYENLNTHLRSERHRAFSTSDEYLVLDKLASTLRCDLVACQDEIPKASGSSALTARAPCRRPRPKREEDLVGLGVFGEEQVPGRRPGGQGGGRTASTSSDRLMFRRVAHKRARRQAAAAPCQGDPRRRRLAGTAPSGGEALGRNPPGGPQLEQDLQTCSTDSSSTSFPQDAGAAAGVCHGGQGRKDVPQDNWPSGEVGVERPPEPEAESASPVLEIRRKVKVCRSRRGTVDRRVPPLGGEKPGAFKEPSLLRLWEIFSSSDTTHGEFLGFED